MNYTLHQLQVFVKVVQNQSITKASEALFMTQPAVSIQLKKFQEQFDIPLTEIIGRQIRITDFGMEIYHLAENILSEVYAINYKTLAYKGLMSGRLRIGVVSTGKYVMPYFLSSFMQAHPGIDLIMDVTNKARVIESLASGEIDFALVSLLPEKLEVDEEILMENELNFVAGSQLLFEKNKLTKEDLEKYALIYREPGSATRKVMENYFQEKNLQVRKKLELTSNEAVKQALIAGLGISIMPRIGIREELKNNKLKIIPSEGLPIKTRWRLIWLRGKQLSAVAQAYFDYLKLHKEEVIREWF